MNQQLDHDHAELDARLRAALAALAADAPDRAFAPLDAFWAGLAVHIRAENLHLFPALLRAAETSPVGPQSPPPATVAAVIARLRADHDFFMSELAAAMKTLRTLRRPDAPPSASAGLAGLRETLEGVRRRLADHNALEETQAYRWVDVLLDSAQQADLAGHIRRELENLPARLTPQATSCAPESDAVCEACGRPDAVSIADRWLCPDCISTAGSCCPEFGACDTWSSETGVAPRCYPNASSNPASHRPGLSTLSIHVGTHHDSQTGGACSPVFTSTAFAFPNPANQNIYPRYFNTPNQQVINRKLAAQPGGEPTANPPVHQLPNADQETPLVTREGQLRYVFNNGRQILLSFAHPHRGHFKALIPRDAWPAFAGLGTEMGRDRAGLYREGQAVRITGRITWYQGDPVVVVTRPEQCEVADLRPALTAHAHGSAPLAEQTAFGTTRP